MISRVHVLMITFAICSSMMAATSCAHQIAAPAVDACDRVGIVEDQISLLPGDEYGYRTSGVRIFLQDTAVDRGLQSGVSVEVSLTGPQGKLFSQSSPAFPIPSGSEVAILLDMDPSLVAVPPDQNVMDSNKKYYFSELFDIVLRHLELDEQRSDGNVVLISVLGRGAQRFLNANGAWNFLVDALPVIAKSSTSDIAEHTQDRLEDWTSRVGSLPRLILIIRLQAIPFEPGSYEVGGLSPIVVLDLNQEGDTDTVTDSGIRVVPLGYAPHRLDMPNWPPRQDWTDKLVEWDKALSDPLNRAISDISRVMAIPELRWPTLLPQVEGEALSYAVDIRLRDGRSASCSKPVEWFAMPSQGLRKYVYINSFAIFLTCLVAALVGFPEMRQRIEQGVKKIFPN